MRRDSKNDKSIYVVLKVEGDTAVCVKPEQKDEAVTFELKDIVRVAEFGKPIYPYLKPLIQFAMHRIATFGTRLKRTTITPCSFWNICMRVRRTAFISTHLIILVQRTGNITTTMWMAMMLTVTASGLPSCAASPLEGSSRLRGVDGVSPAASVSSRVPLDVFAIIGVLQVSPPGWAQLDIVGAD